MEDTAIFAFFKDLDYPEPDYFNQSTLLLWHGKADREALQKASDAITAQHDMLRAVLRDGHLFVRGADKTIPVEEYTLVEDSTEAVKALCEDIQSHLKTGEALVRQALNFITTDHVDKILDTVLVRELPEDVTPVLLPEKTRGVRSRVCQ